MTLSLLMYASMMTTFVVLAGVLAVDAARGLRRWRERTRAQAARRATGRPASSRIYLGKT